MFTFPLGSVRLFFFLGFSSTGIMEEVLREDKDANDLVWEYVSSSTPGV